MPVDPDEPRPETVDADAGAFAWEALTSEPHTGVSVMSRAGRIDYVNPQAAAIYFGPKVTPEQVAGRMIDELYPPAFCEDRRRVITQVCSTGKPVLFRAIWRGFQHHAWIYPMHHEDDVEVQRVMVITRRTVDDVGHIPAHPRDYEYECADVNDLGELEVLTPRELEVLALLGQGLSVRNVAELLRRSPKTVENHRDRVAQKLHARNRADLVRVVQRAGLTRADSRRDSV